MSSSNPMTEPDGQELVHDDTPATPGRPVRLVPTPPGFWQVAGGIAVAMLAPFFGILIGSTVGAEDPAVRMTPLYWGFFVGALVGGLGLVSAFFGARQLMRNSRSERSEADVIDMEADG